MKKVKILAAVLVTCVIVSFGFTQSAYAADNATLTKMFKGYEEDISDFAEGLLASDWKKAKAAAEGLVEKSKGFNELAKKEDNQYWMWETEGMIRHSGELVELCDEKEEHDAYLVSTALFLHITYIKASTPRWLRDHVNIMIAKVSGAINKKDKDAALSGAEAIHLTAHELSLSGVIMEHEFVHTRWVKDARRMHIVGDELQEAIHDGDWEKAGGYLEEVKKILKKITNAFRK